MVLSLEGRKRKSRFFACDEKWLEILAVLPFSLLVLSLTQHLLHFLVHDRYFE